MRTLFGFIFFALVLGTAYYIYRGAASEWAEVTGHTSDQFIHLATRQEWWIYLRPRLIVTAVTIVVMVVLKKMIWK